MKSLEHLGPARDEPRRRVAPAARARPRVRQSTLWSRVPSGITPFCDAGDVGGGDVDERGRDAAVDHAAVEVHRAEQVRLEPLVDRRVEATRSRPSGSRCRCRPGARGTPRREVTVDHRDPLVQERAAAHRRRSGHAGRRTPACGTGTRRVRGDVEPVCERTKRTIRLSGKSADQPLEDDLPQESRDPGRARSSCPPGDQRSTDRPGRSFSTMRQIIASTSW